MRSIVIWFGRLIALIGVLAAIALGLAYYLASHSLPNYTQRLEMAQVSAPVQIVRNASAVPHIFAASDEDALFALGFSHAQDRLFQMMLMRRAAQGLLS